MFVSWNRATEVAAWEFLESAGEDSEFVSLGRVPKTGLETSFVNYHRWQFTCVRAWDDDGNMLGQSQTVEAECAQPGLLDSEADSEPELNTAPILWLQVHLRACSSS